MAKQRKKVGSVQQAEARGFETIGTEYLGTFTGTKVVTLDDKDSPTGKRDAMLIKLTPDDGDPFQVWANAVLADLIGEVKEGDFIGIVYTGNTEAKGKKSGTKLFRIDRYE